MAGVRNHGKYTYMNRRSPRGIGRCDYSGLMVQQHIMKDQLVYSGTGLIKTGLRVNPKFYDTPNPQNLTPLIYLDPPPLINPRPDSEIDVIPITTLTLNVGGSANINLTLEQYTQNTAFVFIGVLTGNVTIFTPNQFTWNDFTVQNETTGAFTLSMQKPNNNTSKITLIRDITMYVCDDSTTLRILNTVN